jgi:hypothetical protein
MSHLLVKQWIDLGADLIDGGEGAYPHVLENAFLVYEIGFRNTLDAEVL